MKEEKEKEKKRKQAELMQAYDEAGKKKEMEAQQLRDMEPARFATKIVAGEAEDLDTIAALYEQKFSEEDWYQAPKKNEDGSTELSFPDEESAMKFCEDIAKKGHAFMMIDATTGQVLAYSNGNGVLNKNEDGKTLDDILNELDAAQPKSGMR